MAARDLRVNALYGATIFLGAFLLFQVQPILGKYILPGFGGTPAVWTACLLFFQTLLLIGYLYSHLLTVRFGARSQAAIHALVLASSLVWIYFQAQRWGAPILPASTWRPAGPDHPTLDILRLLLTAIGLPYFLLSTTGPLLQAWFARAQPDTSPYRLYALSNAGSLLGLVSYPFLVEPALTLRAQSRAWTWGYAVFAGTCAACALITAARSAAASHATQETTGPVPSRGARLLWVALAACASAMLLATTNQISQEVAVVPFLWVLPLSLYLISFIVCFDAPRWYSRRRWMKLLMGAAIVAPVLLFVGPYAGFLVQLGGFSFILLVVCMACHGELVHLKPATQHLTSFYLLLSAGAAAGAAFVALLAPLVFPAYWEFHLALWSSCLLAVVVLVRDRERLFYRERFGPAFYLALLGLVVLAAELELHAWWHIRNTLDVARNFFGVVAVYEATDRDTDSRVRVLRHGGITHGLQFQGQRLRGQPTAYFVPQSGVGLALDSLRRRSPVALRMGVVGLGIGTLAAYGREGDSIRFYEINPAVTRIARGPLFSYLGDTHARVEIVPGDGRLSLERELGRGSQQFDLLVLDAFTSGAPPVHLLTREAFDLYLAHLAPDGILAVNVSNRALDLRPVVQRAAEHSALAVTWTYLAPAGPFHPGGSWMLLTRDPRLLTDPALAKAASPLPPPPASFRQWTDDYSNLFRILR